MFYCFKNFKVSKTAKLHSKVSKIVLYWILIVCLSEQHKNPNNKTNELINTVQEHLSVGSLTMMNSCSGFCFRHVGGGDFLELYPRLVTEKVVPKE